MPYPKGAKMSNILKRIQCVLCQQTLYSKRLCSSLAYIAKRSKWRHCPSEEEVKILKNMYQQPREKLDNILAPLMAFDPVLFEPKLEFQCMKYTRKWKCQLKLNWPRSFKVVSVAAEPSLAEEYSYLQACDMMKSLGLLDHAGNIKDYKRELLAFHDLFVLRIQDFQRMTLRLHSTRDGVGSSFLWTCHLHMSWPLGVSTQGQGLTQYDAENHAAAQAFVKFKVSGLMKRDAILTRLMVLHLPDIATSAAKPDFTICCDASLKGYGAYLLTHDINHTNVHENGANEMHKDEPNEKHKSCAKQKLTSQQNNINEENNSSSQNISHHFHKNQTGSQNNQVLFETYGVHEKQLLITPSYNEQNLWESQFFDSWTSEEACKLNIHETSPIGEEHMQQSDSTFDQIHQENLDNKHSCEVPWFCAAWDSSMEWRNSDSSFIEFYALLCAVYTWKHHFHNKTVLVQTDNSLAFTVIQNGLRLRNDGSQRIKKMFEVLCFTCHKYNIHLQARHVSRWDNLPADALSRLHIEHFKALVPNASKTMKKHKKLDFFPPLEPFEDMSRK